jgi:hypothetical protein
MQASECTLFSGGLTGAEAKFGATAEEHGVEEVNFTFEGREAARARGLRTLSHEELQKGDVSMTYVSKLMNRRYPQTEAIKKVLQTIWYQVNNAQQVFVVGSVLDNGTVSGGTGWGAEFAKLCNKPLYVFDQEKNHWLEWSGSDWRRADSPTITETHFAGMGTRFLSDAGAKAIEDLFARSFRG